MRKFMLLSLAAAAMGAATALAAPLPSPALDFHLFESKLARSGDVSEGYGEVRGAIAAGEDVTSAVSVLRHAGAHCQSVNGHKSVLECYYREVLGVADYTTTYATWDVRLQLNDGKVAAVAVERTTDQS